MKLPDSSFSWRIFLYSCSAQFINDEVAPNDRRPIIDKTLPIQSFRDTPLRKNERRNRGRIDVIGDILHLCTMEGLRRKTHIMQRANLSTDMTNNYIQYLLDRELLRHEHTKKSKGYSVTEKGIMFLRRYLEIKNLIGEDQVIARTSLPKKMFF